MGPERTGKVSGRILGFVAIAVLPVIGNTGITVEYTESRETCVDRNQLRNVYFGDLHVHTGYSLDAYSAGTDVTPDDAYRFARGEALDLMPYDNDGIATRQVTIDRPLDFMAVTDHAEFLGEFLICHDPTQTGYDTAQCRAFRLDRSRGWGLFSTRNDQEGYPTRTPEVCGEDGELCTTRSRTLWNKLIEAAEAHYDRTESCSFTTFVGYEHTAMPMRSNLHRNVIFRNSTVPEVPVSAVDVPKDYMIWRALKERCLDALPGCDVISIPHNSNLSNGKLASDYYEDSRGLEDEQARATLRSELEPLIEIFQHKGNSECRNGLMGVIGAPDELCNFEQVRLFHDGFTVPHLGSQREIPGTNDCNGEVDSWGQVGGGCVSSNDFVRGSLLTGLAEQARLGVNPLKFGFIASTDTHNGAGGQVTEQTWQGNGAGESSPDMRQQDGPYRRTKAQGNPGGLVGVWALENSRDALFDALKRKEAFGTSGPRISPRFFGGWSFSQDVCSAANLVETGYANGVPMGGDLGVARSEKPSFVVAAARDPATHATALQQIQIIKGWLNHDGTKQYEVRTVAGNPDNGAGVNVKTGEQFGDGYNSLCGVYEDKDFDPAVPAYYYMRVVENPSLRWSWAQCLSLKEAGKSELCNSSAPKTIQELAWTSPIWYTPQASN